jgi:peptidylprolyl isomerase domain and WD repeat-containing protein 1
LVSTNVIDIFPKWERRSKKRFQIRPNLESNNKITNPQPQHQSIMSDSSSDDEDFGPKPVASTDISSATRGKKTERDDETTETNEHNQDKDLSSQKLNNHKRRKVASQYEPLYLENLPKADYYEHSYMHRDQVTHVVVSKLTEFIITGSSDGHVKFWKKMMKTIEFVKHYQAHLGAIHDMALSSDQKLLATTSIDKMVKVFEIIGFDMTNMIECDYTPNSAVWLGGSRNVSDRVAVSDLHSAKICIYKAEDASSIPLHVINIHMGPVL